MAKRCTKCGEEKPTSAFYVSKGKPMGLQSACKPCMDTQATTYREKLRQNPRIPPEKKRCPCCGRAKPMAAFSKDRARYDGLTGYCKTCHQKARKAYTPEQIRQERDRKRAVRLKVLEQYGGTPPTCACCAEWRLPFLTIDHINGGGHKHRQTLKSADIYHWLLKHHFPDGFRVLCANCNHAYGRYGTCPHAQERGATYAAFAANVAAVRGLLDPVPSTQEQGQDAPPQCPTHGAMQASKRGKGYYCPRQNEDGSWCTSKSK